MKRSKLFVFGVLCSLSISLIGMSSCAKNQSEQEDEQCDEQREEQCEKQCEKSCKNPCDKSCENRCDQPCEKRVKHGVLEIWETYDAEELRTAFETVNEMTAQDETPLHIILSYYRMYGASLGQAFYRDTARINELLNTEAAKALFPAEVRFAWTHHSISPRAGIHQLVALKVKDDGPALRGDMVEKAYVEEKRDGSWAVDIEMNEKAAQGFKDLTHANIGKSLALVIDGKVYAYPTVQDEITVGRCQIWAPFENEEEAEELVLRLMTE